MRLLCLRSGCEDIGPNMTLEGFYPLVTQGMRTDWCGANHMGTYCVGAHVGLQVPGPMQKCSITALHHHHDWRCMSSMHIIRVQSNSMWTFSYSELRTLALKQHPDMPGEIVLRAEDKPRTRAELQNVADVSFYKAAREQVRGSVMGWDEF